MKRWEVIADLVNAHGWKAGAELGVLKGETFIYLLGHCPDLSMIGVDTFRFMEGQVYTDDGSTYRAHDFDDYQVRVRRDMEPFGDRAKLLVMTTAEAAEVAVDDHSLDFVFIDADHTTTGVSRDIFMWSCKLKPDGWICGHDTHMPTVKETIDAMLPGWAKHDDHVWTIPVKETGFACHH